MSHVTIRTRLAFLVPVFAAALPARDSRCAEPALRELAQRRGFQIGAAVSIPSLNEKEYVETLKREFNICVPENACKMGPLRPARDAFDFKEADKLIAAAQAGSLRVRGHTLVWHQQMPRWLTDGQWTRDEALQIMKEHISGVLQHFKGKVVAWDVVNEAVGDGAPHGIRDDSFWKKAVGEDYVEKAFEFARQADPKVTLYYNDYGAEGGGAKSDAVYELVKKLKARNLVDGVGWQCHFESGWKVNDGYVKNAERLAKLGLEVSITELDLRLRLPSTPEKLEAQAESYRSMLAFCLSQPNIKAMLLWGFTDRASWVPHFFKGSGDALIFDAEYRPKPAYRALEDVFKTAPRR
jgi:endo-1,4-beta-xylanase